MQKCSYTFYDVSRDTVDPTLEARGSGFCRICARSFTAYCKRQLVSFLNVGTGCAKVACQVGIIDEVASLTELLKVLLSQQARPSIATLDKNPLRTMLADKNTWRGILR